jgi:hypothetical protein
LGIKNPNGIILARVFTGCKAFGWTSIAAAATSAIVSKPGIPITVTVSTILEILTVIHLELKTISFFL